MHRRNGAHFGKFSIRAVACRCFSSAIQSRRCTVRKTKQFYLLGKALLSLCVIALIGTACTSAGVAVAPPPATTLTPSSTSGEKFSEGPSPTPFLYPQPSPTFTLAPTPSPALSPLCPGAPEQGNWKCQENRIRPHAHLVCRLLPPNLSGPVTKTSYTALRWSIPRIGTRALP
jgi:hypothetical protein